MIKQGGGGRIINITSVHEDWPMPGNTAYCLSKGGMRMLTRTAGVQLAPHEFLLWASVRARWPLRSISRRCRTRYCWRSWIMRFRSGRMAKPEEIASLVAFLAGDGARILLPPPSLPMAGSCRAASGCTLKWLKTDANTLECAMADRPLSIDVRHPLMLKANDLFLLTREDGEIVQKRQDSGFSIVILVISLRTRSACTAQRRSC